MHVPLHGCAQAPTGKVLAAVHCCGSALAKVVWENLLFANLAAALRIDGKPCGLLDADVYGPSIPLMLVINERREVTAETKLLPGQNMASRSYRRFLVSEGRAVGMRGPMPIQLLD